MAQKKLHGSQILCPSTDGRGLCTAHSVGAVGGAVQAYRCHPLINDPGVLASGDNRFPVDHFLHSNNFRLIELRRLDFVGSDHFPMYLALSYEPAPQEEQLAEDANDREQADEILQDQAQEDAAQAADPGGRS
jgi:hypothetical protein